MFGSGKGGVGTVETKAPLVEAPRRRGLFGSMAQFLTPDRLQIIGHTLQEMNGQTGALDNYLAQRSDENERRMQQQRRRVIESREDTEWQRQEVDERALRAWVETLTPEQRDAARANPRAAHAAFMEHSGDREQYAWQRDYDNQHPEAITPYQQAQLDLTRRGQNISAASSPTMRPLRGPDAAQLRRTQEAAESSRGLRGMVQEFSALQARQSTGPGAGIQVWDQEVRAMDALASRMRGLMRPVGSGATSDYEQRIYARGAPSVDNTRQQNQEIISGIERLAEIQDARQFFYEEYAAATGTMLGAEQAFQQSPDFQALAQQQDQERTGQTGPSNDPLGLRQPGGYSGR